MKTKVKTIWGNGIVSVAEKYVLGAIKAGEALDIECSGKVMKVQYKKLLEKKPREGSFKDKFGRQRDYKLYDFFWEVNA